MSTVTNQNKEATKPEEEAEVRIEIEPIPFDGLLKSKFTSTMELAKLVNSVFQSSMADYEGCVILPNQTTGQLECVLYFKDKAPQSADQVKNLVPVGASQGSKPADRIAAFNSRTSNKIYTLTEDTKQILSKFISVRPGQKINWSQHIFEQAEPTYNAQVIYVRVTGIDLHRILKAVYGGKVEGDRCDYNIGMIRPSGVNNYLVVVNQLDTREVEKLAQSVGLLQTTGAIMMVRGC